MENNIRNLKNYFDKEIIVLTESNNVKTFLLQNCLSYKDILMEDSVNKKEENIFIVIRKEKFHIVKPGEDIFSICLKYGKTEDELKKNNNITQIFIGQQLKI